ncbi:hypothetical protein C8R48DRAFT_781332 [Suillus tomentosus]|nr:hypothetical protein C8R48DRAFT_781332 [Suillus tomentosus]
MQDVCDGIMELRDPLYDLQDLIDQGDVQDVQGRWTRHGQSDDLTFRDFRFLPRLLPNHRFLNERPLLVYTQLVSIPCVISRLCAPPGMPFVTKAPCRAARVVDERDCPPPLIPHDINDYPVYYDALYYPRYHTHHFDTPQNFCLWLFNSLTSHHHQCRACSVVFRGCVAFDGISIVVAHSLASISVSLHQFEASGYRHCVILHCLSRARNAAVSTLVSKSDQYPAWFSQSEQTIANRLSGLLGPVLADAARLLPSGGRGRKKADHVNVIVGHFVQARAVLIALPRSAIDEALSDVVLPSGCDR